MIVGRSGASPPNGALAALAVLAAALAVGWSAAAAESPGRTADEKARIASVTAPTTSFETAEKFETRPGGAATSFAEADTDAFSHPSANMPFERQLDFMVGDGIFRKLWVSAPASTTASDGLGPLYNARSCQRCHLKDGRGHPPSTNWPDDDAVSMFLRLSVPPRSEAEHALLNARRANVITEPTYGGQLQDFSVQGVPAEGRMHITYADRPVTLGDGTVITLRAPTYTVTDLSYGPMDDAVMLSPRVTPPMIGMGLLEMIDPDDILAGADPDDADGDGISGRANRVWDQKAGAPALGRFGWKAGNPTVAQQAAHAFSGDIGIGNPGAVSPWGDCTARQTACLNAPDGNSPEQDGLEASAEMLEKLVFYARNLAVPTRRDPGARQVLDGKRLFYEAGCVACHRPKFVTRRSAESPEQSFQLIWPYTDLLLHDMGPGLADGRPEGVATGTEWRTPPLWGIGLTQTVSGHTFFLHDGRARNLLEAILWHGGEAEAAREAVVAMTAAERAALLAFLNSL